MNQKYLNAARRSADVECIEKREMSNAVDTERVKGASMAARAMCPGWLADARGVFQLPRAGGHPLWRPPAARRLRQCRQ